MLGVSHLNRDVYLNFQIYTFWILVWVDATASSKVGRIYTNAERARPRVQGAFSVRVDCLH